MSRVGVSRLCSRACTEPRDCRWVRIWLRAAVSGGDRRSPVDRPSGSRVRADWFISVRGTPRTCGGVGTQPHAPRRHQCGTSTNHTPWPTQTTQLKGAMYVVVWCGVRRRRAPHFPRSTLFPRSFPAVGHLTLMSGTPARAKREVSRPAKYADSATESDHKNQQVSGSRSPPFTQCRPRSMTGGWPLSTRVH